MAKKLVALISLLVALTAVALAFGGMSPAQRSTVRSAAPAPSARRPVAMVPGLQYNQGTMVPRGIGGADPELAPE